MRGYHKVLVVGVLLLQWGDTHLDVVQLWTGPPLLAPTPGMSNGRRITIREFCILWFWDNDIVKCQCFLSGTRFLGSVHVC